MEPRDVSGPSTYQVISVSLLEEFCTMKFNFVFALTALPLVFASPLIDVKPEPVHIAKRATTTDTATTGYASGYVLKSSSRLALKLTTHYERSVTTGGKGGATVTVSTLDALTSAVAGDTPTIVLVSGTITGNAVVDIGSNKSVIGKTGASE